ncbi:MAG: hypothetical protein WAN35_16625 [Terracidiphilus sp.]
MTDLDLKTVVSNFGSVLQYSDRRYSDRRSSGSLDSLRRCVEGDSLTCELVELFAMKHAYLIRVCIDKAAGNKFGDVSDYEIMEDRFGDRKRLPTSDEAKIPARKLFPAVASGDNTGILSALEGMGVLALCPSAEQQFSRMEGIAEQVTGRARVVFLVELSVFAAEIEDYLRASKYALEAHELNPVGWELYSLSVIEGLAALNDGKVDEALWFLDKSISACLTDEQSCLMCGMSPANFLLAEKLLERDERNEVLRHLSYSRFVWQALGHHIEEWIRLIGGGGRPDFTAGGHWLCTNAPRARLAMQRRHVRSIDAGQDLAAASIPQSRDQVIKAVERMREEYQSRQDTRVLSPAIVQRAIDMWPGSDG